jgi:hypothetical protein
MPGPANRDIWENFMRDFVIKSLDVIVWIVAAVFVAAGVIGGLFALANGQMQGLALIILGPLYAIVFAGWIFLAIGTYNNTKRTADAIEKLANRA